MDDLAAKLRASLANDPENVDAREKLWMEREDLRAKLDREAT